MITAKEAKELQLKALEDRKKKLEGEWGNVKKRIEDKIKLACASGSNSVKIDFEINTFTLERLTNLGYNVSHVRGNLMVDGVMISW